MAEMWGYLRHTLTPEAKKYLEKGGKKVSTEVYTPLSVENKFGAKRTIKGTVVEINERARKELGIDFDYFEANPFKATSIRRAESVKAVEQAKFLKWTVEKYGVSEKVVRAAPDKYVQRDNWASAQSGISGEFEQLQGGHFYPAELGGAPLPWNYITQTREENLEWLSAQLYIENLPERELQREEAWGRYEAEYAAGVEEINARILDNRGRPENEAQKEKRRYDLRKAANIKMYNRQLNTVRAAIRSAEKDLRGEKKKVEDARAKGYSDPASEAQIKVIEAVLAEYRALYEKVSGLRDAEQGKEFELPVQGTDLSRFQPMDIGGYDKYAVRYGKGHELAKPEDIEKLVDLKKITAYYAASKLWHQ